MNLFPLPTPWRNRHSGILVWLLSSHHFPCASLLCPRNNQLFKKGCFVLNKLPTSIWFAQYSRSHFAVEQPPISSSSLLSYAATSVATRFACVFASKKFGSFNRFTISSVPSFKFFVVVCKSFKRSKTSDRDLGHEASIDRSYHRSKRHCINQPSEGFALPARLCLQKIPRTINRGLFCQSSLWFWFGRLACHRELLLSDIAPV